MDSLVGDPPTHFGYSGVGVDIGLNAQRFKGQPKVIPLFMIQLSAPRELLTCPSRVPLSGWLQGLRGSRQAAKSNPVGQV